MRRVAWLALLTAAAACAARPPAPEPVSDPALWEGDRRLYELLEHYPLTPPRRDSLDAYLSAHEQSTSVLLAIAAEDANAPAAVRANALRMLAETGGDAPLFIFRGALTDSDPRVRATAVAALREIAVTRANEAVALARSALADPDPAVQAQALPIIGERDIELLRAYLPRAPNPELAAVARDLIQAAEERGAPLAQDSAAGVLTRTSPHGYTLRFTPVQHWPRWRAAYGNVSIQRGGTEIARLAGIESVAGVVPVFFSSTGTQLVFERGRTIFVLDLAARQERAVGPGIAPRPLPFTDDFFYLREQPAARTEQRHQTQLTYDLLRAPFASTDHATNAGATLGVVRATTSFDAHGSYSPVRWARIEERSGQFYLTADGMEPFGLPDPFTSAKQSS